MADLQQLCLDVVLAEEGHELLGQVEVERRHAALHSTPLELA